MPERKTLWVCEHCLWAIESREGEQITHRHHLYEEDGNEICDWCQQTADEGGFDTLYELL